ncbi:HTH-type transcriptional regulator DmlR [Cupriavidus yeoncheonensis]|uniref:HTH-type transcriptional regulator DmlR n=1 Tax=Cupriavidus yeoncheonensis TaxID=1462994 RepID=A0A916IZG4_9BURK|nr:LysR family transcriptional regulator [Cupriavidus yeoncheonensis]CAG2153628.1 HTH-type transcriptional regulator DmlR [Cupriavidus yeoncheonensis]
MESVRGINTFIRIVQTGNFSRAARELGITPQAASIHVKLIEDWVGVRLLNRSTRKISLTEEGASFYRTCVEAFRSIDDEVERMRDASEEVFGTVKLAAPVGMASRFIAPALGRFLEKYPRVSVDLIVQNRIPDVVAEGIDVGVLPHPLPDSTLIARRVVASPFVLCASPAYLQRHGRPVTIDDLDNHRRIDLRSWVTNAVRPWRLRCGEEVVTSQVRACLVTNDGDSLIEAMLSGAGIGLLTRYRVMPYLRSGRLETVLDGQVEGELCYSIYMQQRNQIPRKVRVMADFLYHVLSLHPDLRQE